MHETLHVFMKDSRHLRLPIAILEAWTVWFVYASVATLPAETAVIWQTGVTWLSMRYAIPVFAVLWCYLIAQVVHADALHGTRQFWLTRPHHRSRLFAAKGLFVLAWITVPLIRPDVAMLRGVVFFRIISCRPIRTCRAGPSVRKMIRAGTCSDNPSRFAA